ncbi:MAG: amidohydrolase [Gammaproteobacteria bacterium]|nr:amidohydrolase [Gammaproteobacteria bacterium]
MNHAKPSLAWCLGLIFAAASAGAQQPASEAADLILEHGAIRVDGGWVEALAIRQGVIIAVGDQASVRVHRGAATRIVDLAGATVVPGLHDMHVHPISAGLQQTECRFAQGTAGAQVLAAVKACVATRSRGEWVTGGQWDAASFGPQGMQLRQLDAVSPDNPVVLTDISYHSVWANSQALRLARIDRRTPNPPGGVIERDARGEPTGVLRESAAGLVRALLPPPTTAQNQQALRWSMDAMLRQGITSFTDALVDEEGLRAYAALADAGQLHQRVRACQIWRQSPRPVADSAAGFAVQRNLWARPRFQPDCVKIALDGVPTDSHTGAMLEPYVDTDGHGDERARGMLMVPAENLGAAVSAFDAAGLVVKMHAAGDGAVRAGLDAIAATRAANGDSGLRHDIAHNSFADQADLRRAKGLSATLEMSPYIWFPNPIIPDVVKAVGPERMLRWTPVKDAIDAGALVVPGSDWSVVPSVNPWLALETLVTRQRPGGGGEVLGASQRISLEQAFDLFTVNAARQMGNQGRTGRIARGMLADLLVLDRNPFRIPVTEVHLTQVRAVVIEGVLVRGELKGVGSQD